MKKLSKLLTAVTALFLSVGVVNANMQTVAAEEISSTNITSLTLSPSTVSDGGDFDVVMSFASNAQHKIASGDTITVSWNSSIDGCHADRNSMRITRSHRITENHPTVPRLPGCY